MISPLDLDAGVQAFGDEMERQRKEKGWPEHPIPPVEDWPEEEKVASRKCMTAALRAMGIDA